MAHAGFVQARGLWVLCFALALLDEAAGRIAIAPQDRFIENFVATSSPVEFEGNVSSTEFASGIVHIAMWTIRAEAEGHRVQLELTSVTEGAEFLRVIDFGDPAFLLAPYIDTGELPKRFTSTSNRLLVLGYKPGDRLFRVPSRIAFNATYKSVPSSETPSPATVLPVGTSMHDSPANFGYTAVPVPLGVTTNISLPANITLRSQRYLHIWSVKTAPNAGCDISTLKKVGIEVRVEQGETFLEANKHVISVYLMDTTNIIFRYYTVDLKANLQTVVNNFDNVNGMLVIFHAATADPAINYGGLNQPAVGEFASFKAAATIKRCVSETPTPAPFHSPQPPLIEIDTATPSPVASLLPSTNFNTSDSCQRGGESGTAHCSALLPSASASPSPSPSPTNTATLSPDPPGETPSSSTTPPTALDYPILPAFLEPNKTVNINGVPLSTSSFEKITENSTDVYALDLFLVSELELMGKEDGTTSVTLEVTGLLSPEQRVTIYVIDSNTGARSAPAEDVSVVELGSKVFLNFRAPKKAIATRGRRHVLFEVNTQYNIRIEPSGFAPVVLQNAFMWTPAIDPGLISSIESSVVPTWSTPTRASGTSASARASAGATAPLALLLLLLIIPACGIAFWAWKRRQGRRSDHRAAKKDDSNWRHVRVNASTDLEENADIDVRIRRIEI